MFFSVAPLAPPPTYRYFGDWERAPSKISIVSKLFLLIDSKGLLLCEWKFARRQVCHFSWDKMASSHILSKDNLCTIFYQCQQRIIIFAFITDNVSKWWFYKSTRRPPNLIYRRTSQQNFSTERFKKKFDALLLKIWVATVWVLQCCIALWMVHPHLDYPKLDSMSL